jgi:hypothetical protein
MTLTKKIIEDKIKQWEITRKRKKTSQHQKRLNVSGWVAPLVSCLVIQTERGNREGFSKALQHLYSRLRGFTIWLYVDRANWHKGEAIESF